MVMVFLETEFFTEYIKNIREKNLSQKTSYVCNKKPDICNCHFVTPGLLAYPLLSLS